MISQNELAEHKTNDVIREPFPTMPFGRWKGYAITMHTDESLIIFYQEGTFNDYPECKEWIEDNLL